MTTSIVSFDAIVKSSGTFTVAEVESYFTPPSNIAGKLCYIECQSIQWDYQYGAPNTSRTTHTVYASWSQPRSCTVENGYTKPGAPLGILQYSPYYRVFPTGPVLCFIPEGQHLVSFTLERTDGGLLAATNTATNYMTLVLKITPANGRQPPLGA